MDPAHEDITRTCETAEKALFISRQKQPQHIFYFNIARRCLYEVPEDDEEGKRLLPNKEMFTEHAV